MNAPNPVLVVGGAGRTGHHVVQKLRGRGYPARAESRVGVVVIVESSDSDDTPNGPVADAIPRKGGKG